MKIKVKHVGKAVPLYLYGNRFFTQEELDEIARA